MMRLRQAVLVTCGVTAGLWFPTRANALPVVTCGMTVSTSITLTQDLSCPTTALFVGRDTRIPGALTIDLGGHTVSSTAGPTIGARDPATTMTLEHGRVAVGDATFSVLDEGASNIYERVTFDGGGISSINDSFPHIFRCRFIHGASVFTGENSVDIEHNTFSGAGAALTNFGETHGAIWLTSTFSTVIDNTITGYGTGIAVFGDLASANIQRNVISRNGVGMRILGPGSVANPLMSVTVRNNLAFSNRGDGIVVGDGTNAAITGNAAIGNGGDGIRIDPSPAFGGPAFGLAAIVTRNVAIANGQWGIETPADTALVTVTDGGANVAHLNGAGQCLNLPCH
jgi:parallel beta-helix repeat protein